MTTVTSEVSNLMQQFEGIVSDAKAIAARLSNEAFNRQPQPGRWSPGQCLEHLNITERKMLESMRPVAQAARSASRKADGPTRHGWMMNWFIRSMEPPPRRRFKTGAAFVPPSSLSKDAVVGEFVTLHEDVVRMLREVEGYDLSPKVQSPFAKFLKYKLGSAFALMAAH
ncbi:MAG: hypothetical protein A2W29_04370, partial [Gemmatimonadetes bacterium RBG_16_66_8]